jgi:hypothetical protein
MARESQQPERMQEQSQQLREMAERMLRDMTPEEREELRQLAQEMQRRGDLPDMPPGAGGGRAGDRPHPADAQRTAPHRGGVEPVDARRPPPSPREQPRERVLAEWFGEGEEQPGDVSRGIPVDALRQAAQSAERGLEQQPIPPRYSDLVRRVFRRYSEGGAADGQ